jgi:hypothetical protein
MACKLSLERYIAAHGEVALQQLSYHSLPLVEYEHFSDALPQCNSGVKSTNLQKLKTFAGETAKGHYRPSTTPRPTATVPKDVATHFVAKRARMTKGKLFTVDSTGKH